jgi:hypothetical protein
MPSPFSGMNPYLEQSDAWEDFHHRFITHLGDELSARVGLAYQVKVESRLYLHELSAEECRYLGKSDVSVTGPSAGADAGVVTAVGAPMQLTLPAFEEEDYTWLEIRDQRSRRVVTAIELVSPTHKTPGPDRDAYARKRSQYIAMRVNFVEIDLRRGGARPAAPEIPACDYYVLVARASTFGKVDFWPLGLRGRLPIVPVPLSPPDADVQVDLQALFHRVFDAAHYGNHIFAETPDPSLADQDAAWNRQFVPAAPPSA